MRWKRVKAKIIKGKRLEVKTETGHIIKYELEPDVLVDIDTEDGIPYFSTGIDFLLSLTIEPFLICLIVLNNGS